MESNPWFLKQPRPHTQNDVTEDAFPEAPGLHICLRHVLRVRNTLHRWEEHTALGALGLAKTTRPWATAPSSLSKGMWLD